MNKFKIKYYKLIFVLIMILGDSYQAPTCNSFPKIFGGSGSSTFLEHIDVFADHLALAGETFDTTLATGMSWFHPFIAVASVAIPDTYYWAKVLSLKAGSDFRGV